MQHERRAVPLYTMFAHSVDLSSRRPRRLLRFFGPENPPRSLLRGFFDGIAAAAIALEQKEVYVFLACVALDADKASRSAASGTVADRQLECGNHHQGQIFRGALVPQSPNIFPVSGISLVPAPFPYRVAAFEVLFLLLCDPGVHSGRGVLSRTSEVEFEAARCRAANHALCAGEKKWLQAR